MDTYTELSRTLRSNITPYAETKWESSVKSTYTNQLENSCKRDLTHVRKSDWLLRWNDKDIYRRQVLKTVDERKKKEQTDKLLNKTKKPIQSKDAKLSKKGSKVKSKKTNKPVKELPKEKGENEEETAKIVGGADNDTKQLESDKVNTKEDSENEKIIEENPENDALNDKNLKDNESLNVIKQEGKSIEENNIKDERSAVSNYIGLSTEEINGILVKEDYSDNVNEEKSEIDNTVEQDEDQNEKGENENVKDKAESVDDMKTETGASDTNNNHSNHREDDNEKENNDNDKIIDGTPNVSNAFNYENLKDYETVNVIRQERKSIGESRIEDEKSTIGNNVGSSVKEIIGSNVTDGKNNHDNDIVNDGNLENDNAEDEKEEREKENRKAGLVNDVAANTETSNVIKIDSNRRQEKNEKENNNNDKIIEESLNGDASNQKTFKNVESKNEIGEERVKSIEEKWSKEQESIVKSNIGAPIEDISGTAIKEE